VVKLETGGSKLWNLAERLISESENNKKCPSNFSNQKLEIPRKLLSEWEKQKSVPILECSNALVNFYV